MLLEFDSDWLMFTTAQQLYALVWLGNEAYDRTFYAVPKVTDEQLFSLSSRIPRKVCLFDIGAYSIMLASKLLSLKFYPRKQA